MARIEDLLAEQLPVWEELSRNEKSLLEAHTRYLDFRVGGHVQGSGSGCAGVILVAAGELRASMCSEGGRQITLFRVAAGECCVLAAACVLPMISFSITLDAAADSATLVIDPVAFSEVVSSNSAMEAFCYRQTASRFSDCMWVMQQVLFASFDARLAAFVLDELSRSARSQVGDTLRITHDEIARHLGSAREVVSRMLKYFEREGWVELGRGVIYVRNRAALRELAFTLEA